MTKRPKVRNLVAKHAHKYNRPATHKSIKDYQRKPKHKNKDREIDPYSFI